MTDYAKLRNEMVTRQIAGRGLRDQRVLDAMGRVPREEFVPDYLRDLAYEDRPLPIGGGQTISQPYMVAYMIAALQLNGGGRVLDIGTGSGYAAAVASLVADEVYSVERIKSLANRARTLLGRLGYTNVHVQHGDGSAGWPEHAPFDGIMVAAAAVDVPDALRRQLKIGCHLVIPLGRNHDFQILMRITRTGEDEFEQTELADVAFVPLRDGKD